MSQAERQEKKQAQLGAEFERQVARARLLAKRPIALAVEAAYRPFKIWRPKP